MNTPTMPASFKRFFTMFLAISTLSLTGCVQDNYQPTLTSIELQNMQSKKFEAPKKLTYAATLSVFQDLGYIIEAADFDTGMITAKSPTKQGYNIFFGQTKMEAVKATAFVEEAGKDKTQVRLNFVDTSQTSTSYGMQGGYDKPIEDATVYQDAFSKISKAVFVRKNL